MVGNYKSMYIFKIENNRFLKIKTLSYLLPGKIEYCPLSIYYAHTYIGIFFL